MKIVIYALTAEAHVQAGPSTLVGNSRAQANGCCERAFVDWACYTLNFRGVY